MHFLICSSPETFILGPYKFALAVGVFYLFIAAIGQQQGVDEMERTSEERRDDIVELGAVSVETKGIAGGAVDLPAGQGHAGILDD